MKDVSKLEVVNHMLLKQEVVELEITQEEPIISLHDLLIISTTQT